jgi:hypothetical protein
MALSRREIAKDVAQQSVEAAIATAGRVSAIVFDSARRITSELGSFGTEIFEITEASRRAGNDADHLVPTRPDVD